MRRVALFFLLIIVFSSCRQEKKDITPVDIDMDVVPYADLLFKDSIPSDKLIAEYPDFSTVFVDHIIASRTVDSDRTRVSILDEFRNLSQIRKLYDTTSLILGDLSSVYADLEKGFSVHKALFPQDTIPTVYTYISEFGVGAFTYEQAILGIGLDFYLGRNFPYPDLSLFPVFLRKRMTKDYIAKKGMQAYLDAKIPMPNRDRMIDIMCRNGKVQYLIDRELHHLSDTVRFDYDEEELDWLGENEAEIYRYFIQENLLYSTDMRSFLKYVGPAPHSPGMPDKAPGATANWIGYRIIKQLVEDRGHSIDEILAIEDGQKLLELAQYKPK